MVENMSTGEPGVVALDIVNTCAPNEEPVVYDGSDATFGTDRDELKVVGQYKQRVADPDACGLGLGALSCMYLGLKPSEGPVCLRFSDLRKDILMRAHTMKAQGSPTHLFPGCQADIQAAAIRAAGIDLGE